MMLEFLAGLDLLSTVLVTWAVITSVFSIFAVTAKFDVNRWIDRRRKKKMNEIKLAIQHACPHTVVDENVLGNNDGVRTLYKKIESVGAWQCVSCRHVRYSDSDIDEISREWYLHREELNGRWSQVRKLQDELTKLK